LKEEAVMSYFISASRIISVDKYGLKIDGSPHRGENSFKNMDTKKNKENGKSKSKFIAIIAISIFYFLFFYLFVSLTSVPSSKIAYPVRGQNFATLLTWPAKILHLNQWKPVDIRLLFILTIVFLSISYISLLLLVRSDVRKGTTITIVVLFVALSLLLLFMPSMFSRDVYSYIFYGRAKAFLGANPYIAYPKMFPKDIVYQYVGWKETPSAYGPFFTSLSSLIALVANNNLVANVFLFKLVAFLFYAASLPVLFSLTRKLSPGKENFALAGCATCPLFLIHIVGGAHNEFVMVFFVLLCFWLLRKGHAYTGILSLAIAICVKIVAILVLPSFFLFILREKKESYAGKIVGKAILGIMSFILPISLMYLPYWKGSRTFGAIESVGGMYSFSSVPAMIQTILLKIACAFGIKGMNFEKAASSFVRGFFILVFLFIAVVLFSKVRDFKSMVSATASVFLIWILTSPYILPWYLCLGLTLSIILGADLTAKCSIAASIVFMLYRIPPIPPLKRSLHDPYKPLSSWYIAVPLLIIFAFWVFSSTYQMRKKI